MKVIICGAGRVGSSIAAYLSREPHHEIILIDTQGDLVSKASEIYDVKGVTGHAAHPDVLVRAGVREADAIIAVTELDEVNMVATQVAHSLFNVPKKIARLRAPSYLDAQWSNLFSRNHMPIDSIISPEYEVANAIIQRLSIPGTTNDIILTGGGVHCIGLTCEDDCPLLNTQLKQLPTLFSDLDFSIIAIFRGYDSIPVTEDAQFRPGDEVYVLAKEDDLDRVRAIFGHHERQSHSFVIIGGGNIGARVAQSIKRQNKKHSVKLVEANKDRATFLAADIAGQGITIIQGDGLDQNIVNEAEIARTDTAILVTNDDECNVIGGVIAKKQGCERVISLVNKVEYASLAYDLGLDTLINPSAITVSTILRQVRKGRIRNIHTIRDGALEVLEAEIPDNAKIVGMNQQDLSDLNPNIRIGAVIRGEEITIASPAGAIQAGDKVVLSVPQSCASELEGLVSAHVEIY